MNVTCRVRALSTVYAGSSMTISQSEVQKKTQQKKTKKTKNFEPEPALIQFIQFNNVSLLNEILFLFSVHGMSKICYFS